MSAKITKQKIGQYRNST